MRVAATHSHAGQFVIDSADLENFKPAQGEAFVVDIARRRNVGHHRKAFSLLKAMHENQDRFEDISFEQFRRWAVLAAGFFDAYSVGEREYVVPQSLAFDKMDQTEFERVYTALVTVAVEELGQNWALSYE